MGAGSVDQRSELVSGVWNIGDAAGNSIIFEDYRRKSFQCVVMGTGEPVGQL